GNGRGGNRNEDEGEFVWSGNNGIMTSIDAGEDHWVAVTGTIPVAPALATQKFSQTLGNCFPLSSVRVFLWRCCVFTQNHCKVTMQHHSYNLVVVHKNAIHNLAHQLVTSFIGFIDINTSFP